MWEFWIKEFKCSLRGNISISEKGNLYVCFIFSENCDVFSLGCLHVFLTLEWMWLYSPCLKLNLFSYEKTSSFSSTSFSSCELYSRYKNRNSSSFWRSTGSSRCKKNGWIWLSCGSTRWIQCEFWHSIANPNWFSSSYTRNANSTRTSNSISASSLVHESSPVIFHNIRSYHILDISWYRQTGAL